MIFHPRSHTSVYYEQFWRVCTEELGRRRAFYWLVSTISQQKHLLHCFKPLSNNNNRTQHSANQIYHFWWLKKTDSLFFLTVSNTSTKPMIVILGKDVQPEINRLIYPTETKANSRFSNFFCYPIHFPPLSVPEKTDTAAA